jgi:hypothetical protein
MLGWGRMDSVRLKHRPAYQQANAKRKPTYSSLSSNSRVELPRLGMGRGLLA